MERFCPICDKVTDFKKNILFYWCPECNQSSFKEETSNW